MQYPHIIMLTHAIPAKSLLPKPSPLDLMKKWLAVAVTLIVLSQRTTMIDRFLAEDLAAAFDVPVGEIPCGTDGVMDFVCTYMENFLSDEENSVPDVMDRLQTVAGRLEGIIARLARFLD